MKCIQRMIEVLCKRSIYVDDQIVFQKDKNPEVSTTQDTIIHDLKPKLQDKKLKFSGYNDDEKLIQTVETKIQDKVNIDVQIKAQRTVTKLKQTCTIPAMIEIKTSGGNRTNVDLICVLDISSSMGGEKIDLVKKTMKYVLEALSPSDRLCIITFSNTATRICPLKLVSKQNISQFNRWIDDIYSCGGTCIIEGMQTALKVMKDRTYKNDVTSVFLLSDGQDNKKTPNLLVDLMNSKKYKGIDTFSIQSFGFGKDHDEDLMTEIAKVMDGNFFFIKELDTLDEAFCSALGGIISVVAKELTLNIQNISKGRMKDVKISKTYGGMWRKIKENQYQIKLIQLISGIQKNYVFELEIPNIDGKVEDFQRDHDIIACQFKANNTNNQYIDGQAILKLTLLNSNQQILEINENNDVLEHFLRMRAAEQIQKAIQKSESNQHQTAQKNLDIVIKLIEQNKKVRKQKMKNLLQDLQITRKNCSKEIFQLYGRKQSRSCQYLYSQQKSSLNSSYQSQIQISMVQHLKYTKKFNSMQ